MAILKSARKPEAPCEDAPKPQKPHAAGGHDESNWLVSYADMMTLLCGFFVLMFSLATMDERKYEKAKESLSKQFGGKYEKPHQEMATFVTQLIQDAGIEKETSIQVESSGVVLTFQSTVFFDTLSADVKTEGQAVLAKLAEALKQKQDKDQKKYKVVIEGHTDARPVQSPLFPSNWELSGNRASRVVRLFIEKSFAPDQLIALAYGDTRPLADSKKPDGSWDETALSKNRRVVIRVLNPQTTDIPFSEPSSSAEPERSPASPAH